LLLKGSILLLVAVALLAAPSAFASVGKQSYEGPAATDGVDGRSPTVRLKVEFKKTHHRRGAPSRMVYWAQRAVALRCPDGSKTYAGPGTELDGGPGTFDELGFTGQRIKKGKFSVSEPSADEGDTQTVTGHVSKKGNATGTIRIVAFNPFKGQTCDSGVVNWTASPVSAFGPVVQPPCAFQGNCPLSARAAGYPL
jgi:hypothetical protein